MNRIEYDIYGDRLKPGHCEVHPHMPFEYPCPECRNEQDDRDAHYQAYKEHCREMEPTDEEVIEEALKQLRE